MGLDWPPLNCRTLSGPAKSGSRAARNASSRAASMASAAATSLVPENVAWRSIGCMTTRHPVGDLNLTLPLDRLIPDVAAAEAVGPADVVDRRIGARLRLPDARPERAHIEHAAAIGDDTA